MKKLPYIISLVLSILLMICSILMIIYYYLDADSDPLVLILFLFSFLSYKIMKNNFNEYLNQK